MGESERPLQARSEHCSNATRESKLVLIRDLAPANAYAALVFSIAMRDFDQYVLMGSTA
jgi:hypothetical protein